MPGKPVHLIGESLSGMIGLRFAAAMAERLRGPALRSSPPGTQRAFARGVPGLPDCEMALGMRGEPRRTEYAPESAPSPARRLGHRAGGGRGPPQTMSKRIIIARSSCTELWQCMT
jgi:pimeloyl-ACP methyl ester carboxylesterase